MPASRSLAAALLLAAQLSAFGYVGGDSLHYLGPRDTVALEIDDAQRKYTVHRFAPKQTVYSLARFYAQDIDQVYALNPELAETEPHIGDSVRIAVPNVAITRFRGPGFDPREHVPVTYTIRAGETMYHLAKTIFRMPVDTLLAVNGLSSTTVQPGQVLQVGWMHRDGAAGRIRPRALTPLEKRSRLNGQAYANQTDKIEPVRGVASFSPGSGEASGRLFALTDLAPRGTYLKVTNTTDGRVAYVRVVGAAPHNLGREKITIQVSGTAARILGATQGNFYVLVE